MPGWMIAHAANAALAEALLADTVSSQGVGHGQLTIHADRGSPMTAKPVAHLLADLSVTKNPQPTAREQRQPLLPKPIPHPQIPAGLPRPLRKLPGRPRLAQAVLRLVQPRPPPENHRHSGIGYHTPADVHYGRAEHLRDKRAVVLSGAYDLHPERFVRKPPEPPKLPTIAWINQPKEDTTTTQ